MDCEVIPKMKTRKDKYSDGFEFFHISVIRHQSHARCMILRGLEVGRMKQTFHVGFDLCHGSQDLSIRVVDLRTVLSFLNIVEDTDSTVDQGARLLDHVHMGQDESCLGTLWVETFLERTDQAKVIVRKALGWVVELVVEEGVRDSIRHEWGDVQAVNSMLA